MSQLGRQLEAPRPLKSSIKQQPIQMYQQSFEVNTMLPSVEDLISLMENVAQSLAQGDVSVDLFNKMFTHLSMHGPQLEITCKEILDRCFIIYRNASQDDRLKISIRLNLLNLIELRANSWQLSEGLNTYYKHKAATNVEPENDMNVFGTSPSMGMASVGQSLLPGEIVKNSGKFSKPTKIPGKNYSKDEIIIRNADSGKVNPGAKERLVQITGSNEESINYAKLLIEDTIKRNASPIREASQEGSCSSLASSDDQQVTVAPRTRAPMSMNQQHQTVGQMPMANKLVRSNSHHNSHYLTHSLSTNDANLGEYKYTVSVGNHNLKITGDSLELVRVAKLVLDDYFTNDEFLKSSEALTLNVDAGIPQAHQLPSQPSPFIDSGVHLDLLTRSSSNLLASPHFQLQNEADDEVFMNDVGDAQVLTSSSSVDSSSSSNTVVTEPGSSPGNGLCRSRRSHFSRKDATPEMANKVKSDNEQRIIHPIKSLWWFYENLPLCKALPHNFDLIREMCPAIIRDKSSSPPAHDAPLRYSDVEKFLEKRLVVETTDDVIEVDDDD